MRCEMAAAVVLVLLALLAFPRRGPAAAQEAGRETRETQERVDLHGDPLPKRALLRLGSLRFRHQGDVLAVAYSPDGKTVLSGSKDGTARLWDAATGKEIRRFETDTEVSSVAFSPDGRLVAAAGGEDRFWGGSREANVVRIWVAATGKRVQFLRSREEPVHSIAFSPDGETIAAAVGEEDDGNRIRLWEVSTGKLIHALDCGKAVMITATFSPDGKRLFSAGVDGTLRSWDVTGGEEIRKIDVPGEVRALALSPDGHLLASAHADGGVRLWDANTIEKLRFLDSGTSDAFSIAFSPDGKTLAVGRGKASVDIFAVEGEKRTETLAPRGKKALWSDRQVRSVAFSPDGKTLAAAAGSAAIHFRDVATGEPVLEFAGHEGFVCSVAFSPDGETIASGGADRTVRLWSRATGEEERSLAGHVAVVRSVAFSPDGERVASGGADESVRIWEATSGKAIHSWRLGSGAVSAWIGGGRPGRGIRLWQRPVTTVAFSPDGGTLFAACGDDSVHRIGMASKERKAIWQVDEDSDMLGWRWMLRRPRDEILSRPDLILDPWEESAGISRDGGTIVFRSKWTAIRTWEVAAGESRIRMGVERVDKDGPIFDSEEPDITAIALSPDGRTVASADGGGVVHLWELVTGTQIREWPAHRDLATSVAFSPDGRIIATSGVDETIRLWDAMKPERLAKLKGHDGMVFSVAFSPDGETLASGALDGTVLLWDIREARGKIDAGKRDLSAEEVEGLWTDLAGEDAAKAHVAIRALVADPKTAIPVLEDRFRPLPEPDADRIRHLVERLDHDEFAEREKASARLRDLGDAAEPELRKALEGDLTPEVQTRIEAVIRSSRYPFTGFPNEGLRRVRAMQVLEGIGTAEAARILDAIASGSSSPRERADARACLRRMEAPKGKGRLF